MPAVNAGGDVAFTVLRGGALTLVVRPRAQAPERRVEVGGPTGGWRHATPALAPDGRLWVLLEPASGGASLLELAPGAAPVVRPLNAIGGTSNVPGELRVLDDGRAVASFVRNGVVVYEQAPGGSPAQIALPGVTGVDRAVLVASGTALTVVFAQQSVINTVPLTRIRAARRTGAFTYQVGDALDAKVWPTTGARTDALTASLAPSGAIEICWVGFLETGAGIDSTVRALRVGSGGTTEGGPQELAGLSAALTVAFDDGALGLRSADTGVAELRRASPTADLETRGVFPGQGPGRFPSQLVVAAGRARALALSGDGRVLEASGTPATGFGALAEASAMPEDTRAPTAAQLSVAMAGGYGALAVPTQPTGSGAGTAGSVFDAVEPVAGAVGGPGTATAGTPVTFTLDASDAVAGVASIAWSFGDGGTAQGASVVHAFAGAGERVVTATVTDRAGNITTARRTVTVTAAPDVASPLPPAPKPPAPKPPAADRTPPLLSGLRAMTVRSPARGLLTGTVGEAGVARVVLQRRASGRRKGGRCVAGRATRASQRCTRYVPVRLVRKVVPAGAFAVRLPKVATGRYRLAVVALDAAGNASPTRLVGFRVKAKRRR